MKAIGVAIVLVGAVACLLVVLLGLTASGQFVGLSEIATAIAAVGIVLAGAIILDAQKSH